MPSARKRKQASAASKSAALGGGRKRPSARIDLAMNDPDDDSYGAGDDDHLHSDDEGSMGRELPSSSEDDEEEEDETAEAKRVRLAREYLRRMEEKVGGEGGIDITASSSAEEEEESDEGDYDDGGKLAVGPAAAPHDRVGRALARERLKREGALERRLANKLRSSVATLWEEATDRSPLADPKLAGRGANAEAEGRAFVDSGAVRLFRGHDLTPTCVALRMPAGDVAYSASKDGSVLMWDVESQARVSTVCTRWSKSDGAAARADGEVLALACSDDGRYLAAGCRDATVRIYDVRVAGRGVVRKVTTGKGGNKSSTSSPALVNTFRGHKGPITALAFRPQSLQLFSGSSDRCVRHHNLEEMAYVETLYGHQAGVTAVACPRRVERPITAGRDRTVRAWKLAEESHLIFRGGGRTTSADCVAVMDDNWFLTGHEDGALSLWLTDKKRAVATVEASHGRVANDDANSPSAPAAAAAPPLPRGVACCSALPGSDLAVTGSSDGYVRLWQVSTGPTKESRGLEPIGKVPLRGYVNGIALGPRGRFCVAAVGQEPRLGRWDRVPRAKNRFAIVRLRGEGGGEEDDDDEEEALEEEGVEEVGDQDGAEGSSGASSSDDDDSDEGSSSSSE